MVLSFQGEDGGTGRGASGKARSGSLFFFLFVFVFVLFFFFFLSLRQEQDAQGSAAVTAPDEAQANPLARKLQKVLKLEPGQPSGFLSEVWRPERKASGQKKFNVECFLIPLTFPP